VGISIAEYLELIHAESGDDIDSKSISLGINVFRAKLIRNPPKIPDLTTIFIIITLLNLFPPFFHPQKKNP